MVNEPGIIHDMLLEHEAFLMSSRKNVDLKLLRTSSRFASLLCTIFLQNGPRTTSVGSN